MYPIRLKDWLDPLLYVNSVKIIFMARQRNLISHYTFGRLMFYLSLGDVPITKGEAMWVVDQLITCIDKIKMYNEIVEVELYLHTLKNNMEF